VLQRRVTNREPPLARSRGGSCQGLTTATAAKYYHAVRYDDDAEADASDLTFI
jgi:hypothetical protein